eukprot:CAMPEP_0177723264 /NCGR_PEP_ID=MMETSP0484_2-20121128/18122_1 /TAXON_ID=354590 /ORGANISM="Rhodomonas lens, Strain RHODO" /LENGTH=304 /DNA_ID=CAMNT_0019235693 /DNA_START=56 /DNA_END=970 /DNA_ORIENTATION=+
MATGPPASEIQEHFDSDSVVNAKVFEIAKLMTKSHYTVLYTGAGLSTSAGIPDFRGPQGVWTLKDQGKKAKRVDLSSAAPTVGHKVCKELLDIGLVQHITSQNVDGLHRKSGVLQHQLSELHGNTNLEVCKSCGAEYFRSFRCRRAGNHVHDHRTGRFCEQGACQAELHDSIINFSEDLPAKDFNAAQTAFAAAELCIVLGSSCRVTPAADLPEQIGTRSKTRGGPKLVIVNLQVTPLDRLASIRVHAKTDEFLSKLAAQLALPGFVVEPESEPVQVPATETPHEGGRAAQSESPVNGSLRIEH